MNRAAASARDQGFFRQSDSARGGAVRRCRPLLEAAALIAVVAGAGGCGAAAHPIYGPEERLKRVLNPIGTQAEQRAFERQVDRDPFPSAAKTGL